MELPAQSVVFNKITPPALVFVTITCVSLSLKKVVLAAALVVMPLQGVAATLSVVLCHGDSQMHAMHSNSGQDRGAHQDRNQDEDSTSGNSVFHPCHNSVSAPLMETLLAAVPDFPVRAFAPDPLHDLFVPDRPQRPPLA